MVLAVVASLSGSHCNWQSETGILHGRPFLSDLYVLQCDTFLLSGLWEYPCGAGVAAWRYSVGTAKQCCFLLFAGDIVAVIFAENLASIWKVGAAFAKRKLVSCGIGVYLYGVLSDSEFCTLDAAAAGWLRFIIISRKTRLLHLLNGYSSLCYICV